MPRFRRIFILARALRGTLEQSRNFGVPSPQTAITWNTKLQTRRTRQLHRQQELTFREIRAPGLALQ